MLRRFEKNGYRNCKRDGKRRGGRVRELIGSAALEEELLSNKVLQDMAPLNLQRRVDLIRQKWGVSCNKHRLLRFYRQNHLTWRVTSL